LIDDEQRRRHARDTRRHVLITTGLICGIALIMPLVAPLVGGFSFLRFPIGMFVTVIGTFLAIIGVIFWAAERQDKLDRRYGLTSEF
jgi:putative solute:sodium symporter small subunit